MDTYERSGPILTPGRRYFYVALAARDHINKACVYPFPTERAAEIFAKMSAARCPGRVIVIHRPATRKPVTS